MDAALAGLGLALAGCRLVRSAAETPARVAEAVLPRTEPERPDVEGALADLLRYADLVVMRVDQALEELEASVGTREAQLAATRTRLDFLRWTTQVASGPNSLTGMLDLLVTVATQRWMFEDHWIPEVWGEAARPVLAALELSERDGWELVERWLTPEQVAEARALLERWRAQHPELERDSLVAFPSFRTLAATEDDARAASLLGALGLDPLAGLEPAAREVELARQLGQRALFSFQRLPRILGAELELRLHDAHEELGFAVAELGAELAEQRTGLVRDLAEAEAPVAGILQEARATLEVGGEASGDVARAVEALDAFVARFDEPEDRAEAVEEPEGEPFDVGDYGAAAARIGAAADDVTTLLVELDRRLPEAHALLDAAAARGAATVDRATRALLLVGLALIAAGALAGWLVRRTAPRAG